MNIQEKISEITTYVKKLEEENMFLHRRIGELERENMRLKENEKEMLNVSSIISTANENSRLKQDVQDLKQKLRKKPLSILIHKGCSYYLDSEDILYDLLEDDIKGEQVGYRKYLPMKKKYKIVLNELHS